MIEEAFIKVDKDNDNKISFEELKTVIQFPSFLSILKLNNFL